MSRLIWVVLGTVQNFGVRSSIDRYWKFTRLSNNDQEFTNDEVDWDDPGLLRAHSTRNDGSGESARRFESPIGVIP